MGRERAEHEENASTPTRSGLSVAELRQLISLVNGSDIDEVIVEHEADGLKLVLRKVAPVALSAGGHTETEGVEEAEEPVLPEANSTEGEVRSPLVGIFRVSMKPGGHPMVSVGDIVREGQVVGAIESLNVLNEIEVSAAGRVTDILVSDGQAVEYGQSLFVVAAL